MEKDELCMDWSQEMFDKYLEIELRYWFYQRQVLTFSNYANIATPEFAELGKIP